VRALAWRAELRARARGVLEPVFETRGGYCFADGTIIEEEARSLRRGPPPGGPRGPRGSGFDGPPFGPPPFGDGPPPFGDGPGRPGPGSPMGGPRAPFGPPDAVDPDRDAVGATPPAMPDAVRTALLAACARDAPAAPSDARVEAGDDAVLVSLAADRGGVRSFALRFAHADAAVARDVWSWRFFALALLTLALVAVTVDALLALRRGASGLSRALSTIETDLRAEVPAVPGKEFADVAERIRRVATHLADARERERALERKVAHDNRLASLGRVVAGVAHEVRNPLTGMKLLLDGLARRALDARSAEDVEVCLSELARLEHLVTSLLGVARSGETGRFVQDIAGLVDERLAVARDVARPRGITLERSGEARIFAVRDVLVRVIDNLLRNAIEASPSGGTVRVVVSPVGREGNVERVEIDVQDGGPGVPEAAREELFEPFRTTKADGTGLGLWLSHTALTAQGATLDYRREGDVTHFVIGLPKEPS
jgi:signal transduction histidine kinase